MVPFILTVLTVITLISGAVYLAMWVFCRLILEPVLRIETEKDIARRKGSNGR